MSEETKVKISAQTAESELKEFADSLDVDINEKSNESHKNRLVRAMVDGRLLFESDDKGKLRAVQITENSTRIVYGAVTAQSKVEMQKHENTIDGLYAFLGHITKLGPDALKQLEDRDGKIMDAIAVFLAV